MLVFVKSRTPDHENLALISGVGKSVHPYQLTIKLFWYRYIRKCSANSKSSHLQASVNVRSQQVGNTLIHGIISEIAMPGHMDLKIFR